MKDTNMNLNWVYETMDEIAMLKKKIAVLNKALRNVVKSHRMYDAVEYAKEGIEKAKKIKH